MRITLVKHDFHDTYDVVVQGQVVGTASHYPRESWVASLTVDGVDIIEAARTKAWLLANLHRLLDTEA